MTVRDVVVFAGLFPPAVRGGGGIRSLDALVSAAQPGYTMHVLTTNTDLGDPKPLAVRPNTWLPYRAAQVMYLEARPLQSLALAVREVWRIKPELYYLNSFFSSWFTILPLVLIRCGVLPRAQVLVAPRGELSHGALAIKSAKKRAYLRLFLACGIGRSISWHAASDREGQDIERVVGASGARVVVWERDTILPAAPHDPPAPVAENQPLRLVFVSRIVVIKGLATLLSALQLVRERVDLDIYGPREDAAYWGRCAELIDALPGNVRVSYHGMIGADRAVETFENYDLFAFPTAGENFSHVIAESLAASCPVMIADCTPWTDVVRGGGGVLLDSAEPADWARCIEAHARMSTAERQMRRHAAGRAYIGWRNRPRGADLFELARQVSDRSAKEFA